MERKLEFPRKKGNYVIVLEKVKDGMSIQKFDHDGKDVTIYPNMYTLKEVLASLRDDYQIEKEES